MGGVGSNPFLAFTVAAGDVDFVTIKHSPQKFTLVLSGPGSVDEGLP
jgi:hypothetical protein